jgi:hypothetical protein
MFCDCKEKYLFGYQAEARRLNASLDAAGRSHAVNEDWMTACLAQTEALAADDQPEYWLLLMRLNELALWCAGNYADGAEFSAAGDLLVNPREVWVAVGDRRQPLRKWRHGRMTDQFGPSELQTAARMGWLKSETHITGSSPPLLPWLNARLEASGRVAPGYLAECNARMRQITETIVFLSSWQIRDAADLSRRLGEVRNGSRAQITAHLCRFNLGLFFEIGASIDRRLGAAANSGPQSAQAAVHP